MPATQWNDEEDEAMQGLPHLAVALYLRGLRKRMDYATGKVGNLPGKNILSMFWLQQVMKVERPRGSTLREDQHITEKQIRIALKQLQSRGLVTPLPKRSRFSPMIFLLPLASTGLLGSQEEGRRKGEESGASGGAGAGAKDTPYIYTPAESGGARGEATGEAAMKGVYLVSGSGQIDMSAKMAFGDAMQMLIDGMCSPAIATNKDHRLKLKEILALGPNRGDIASALEKARAAKQGQKFSVFYLAPIIQQAVEARMFPKKETSRVTYAKLAPKGGAGFIAAGCENMQRQRNEVDHE